MGLLPLSLGSNCLPWAPVPNLPHVSAAPSPCSALLPKEGCGHQVHTKAMILFPNTFPGIQPWEKEGWARK